MEIIIIVLIVSVLWIQYDCISGTTALERAEGTTVDDLKMALAIEDRLIQLYDRSDCAEKMICLVASLPKQQLDKVKHPLGLFVQAINSDLYNKESFEAKQMVDDYPKMKQLIAVSLSAYISKNASKCSIEYGQCQEKESQLMAVVNDYGKLTNLSRDNPLREVLQLFFETTEQNNDSHTIRKRGIQSCRTEQEEGCCIYFLSCAFGSITCTYLSLITFGAFSGPCIAIGAGCIPSVVC